MKKINYFIAILVLLFTFSCGQRVEMDMSQWGDTAFITNVQIFTLEVKDDFQMEEFYNSDGQLVEGVRQVTISDGAAVVDNENFTVHVKLKAGQNLDLAGILIYHRSMRVEERDNSPRCGIAKKLDTDQFKYRLHSADGTTHDWTISVD